MVNENFPLTLTISFIVLWTNFSLDFEHKIKIIAGSGCYSYVGFQGIREQTISLREVGCLSRGTVQHEFMHALGFYHEQARPDAKEHVKIQEWLSTLSPRDLQSFQVPENLDKNLVRFNFWVRFNESELKQVDN